MESDGSSRTVGSIITFRCRHCGRPNETRKPMVSVDFLNDERAAHQKTKQRLTDFCQWLADLDASCANAATIVRISRHASHLLEIASA